MRWSSLRGCHLTTTGSIFQGVALLPNLAIPVLPKDVPPAASAFAMNVPSTTITKTEKAEPLADFLFFPGILFFQALWKRHVQAGAIVNISGGRQEA